MRAAAITVILSLLVLCPRLVAADSVGRSIHTLHNNASSKARTAAVGRLVKKQDPRIVGALADAVRTDINERVRMAAAFGLWKVVKATSSATDRQLAVHALLNASKQDRYWRVRHAAKSVHRKLTATTASTYFDVGSMSAPNPHASLASNMRRTVDKLVNTQSDLQTSAPGGGYRIDVVVKSISQQVSSGASAILRCNVELVLASYPGNVTVGLVSGSAAVSISATTASAVLSAAAGDCVDAVLEDMVITKVFPTIKTLAAQGAATKPASSEASSTDPSAE